MTLRHQGPCNCESLSFTYLDAYKITQTNLAKGTGSGDLAQRSQFYPSFQFEDTLVIQPQYCYFQPYTMYSF